MKPIRKLDTVKAYLRTSGKCYICGTELGLENDNSPSMMVTSVTHVGIIACCAGCSRRRKGMSLEEYRLVLQTGDKKIVFYGEKKSLKKIL